MQFGVFDHMDASGEPLAELFENRIKLAEAYDRLGLYALHVAEHHSTPLGMSPSPSVFLALARSARNVSASPPCLYAAAPPSLAPRRGDLHPRPAERRRLELGVGRGVSPLEIASFGVDPAKSQAMYLEAFQVVIQALGSRSVTFKGEYYTFDDVPFIFEPVQKPHPPLWYGVFNAESTEWAAKTGVNVVTNLPAAAVRMITDRYRAEWAKLGRDPKRIPFMGMNRHIVVAETDREAMEIGRRAYRRWFRQFLEPVAQAQGPLAEKHRLLRGLGRNRGERAGDRRIAADGARGDRAPGAESGVNYVLARFAFGDLSLEESLHSAELFARAVMPELVAA